MIWKNRELYTIADLIIAVESLKDVKEARAFKHIYISEERAIGTDDAISVVDEHLHYITSMLGDEERERARDWLGIA